MHIPFVGAIGDGVPSSSDICPTKFASPLVRRGNWDPNAFRSFDSCLHNLDCKIIFIAGVAVAGLLLLWTFIAVVRCFYVGADVLTGCCCCCTRRPPEMDNPVFTEPNRSTYEPTVPPEFKRADSPSNVPALSQAKKQVSFSSPSSQNTPPPEYEWGYVGNKTDRRPDGEFEDIELNQYNNPHRNMRSPPPPSQSGTPAPQFHPEQQQFAPQQQFNPRSPTGQYPPQQNYGHTSPTNDYYHQGPTSPISPVNQQNPQRYPSQNRTYPDQYGQQRSQPPPRRNTPHESPVNDQFSQSNSAYGYNQPHQEQQYSRNDQYQRRSNEQYQRRSNEQYGQPQRPYDQYSQQQQQQQRPQRQPSNNNVQQYPTSQPQAPSADHFDILDEYQ